MKQFVVQQGIISKSGNGDMYIQDSFDHFKDALNYANSIKVNVSGWVGKGNLVTEIIDISNDYSIEWQFTLNR